MRLFILGGTLALASACAHGKIGDTSIDNTSENREILALIDTYQQAVERLDADAVLELVHPSFYEDNANTDSGDDYDYAGLQANLRKSFATTDAMQLILRVDSVEVKDDEAFAELQYEYRAHNTYPAGAKWETGTDRTRLHLVRSRKGPWRIIAGL